MTAGFGALSGWLSFSLIAPAAIIGRFGRRRRGRPLELRMRPHYVLGYAIVAVAVAHVAMSLSALSTTNPAGIRLAFAALCVLGVQAFVGASLQAPGLFRRPLRAWHRAGFIATFALAAGHVAFSAPAVGAMMANRRAVHSVRSGSTIGPSSVFQLGVQVASSSRSIASRTNCCSARAR